MKTRLLYFRLTYKFNLETKKARGKFNVWNISFTIEPG